jgi:hypothetical protein
MMLQALIAMVAGRIHRHQHHVITSLKSVMHDRDTTCTEAFDAMWRDSGVEAVVLLPRSPHVHAHGERFGRPIKEKVRSRMRFMGEAS